MKCVQKTFFKGKYMCAPSFLVCAHLATCVHTHSLEGTLFRSHYRHANSSTLNLLYCNVERWRTEDLCCGFPCNTTM